MIPLAFPGAYALMGMIELVSGVEFSRFAESWDELAGWQRGILGTLIVIVATIVIMGCAIIFGQPA